MPPEYKVETEKLILVTCNTMQAAKERDGIENGDGVMVVVDVRRGG